MAAEVVTAIASERPEEEFTYLDLHGVQLMLEEIPEDSWLTGPLERPLGRGINFQIAVPTITTMLQSLAAVNWTLFSPPEHRSYRTGDVETRVRQFLVQDPDGYLIRFSEHTNR